MHIIIDGYNVLKQVLADEIGMSQRRAFINMLGKYAARKNHTITVIFDGGPDTWPTQEKDHGITIIYSGTKQSADDVIKKLLAAKKYGVLLVSSDNELKAVAARQESASIDAYEFYMLVKNKLTQKNEQASTDIIIKTTAESVSLVDELMQSDKTKMYKYDELTESQRSSPAQRLSKKERAYVQKIKKL